MGGTSQIVAMGRVQTHVNNGRSLDRTLGCGQEKVGDGPVIILPLGESWLPLICQSYYKASEIDGAKHTIL